MTSPSLASSAARLRRLLEELPDLVVAVSGGVDSAVLWHAATAALGDRAVGWIGDSPSLPRRELAEAVELARSLGARLVVHPTPELDDADYRANGTDRCYFCRRALFATMRSWAGRNGFTHLAYGEITDDLLDHRPGRRAAGELCVRAPLLEAGFSKELVREYARVHGLSVAEKPSLACLASRLPHGTPVTPERLRRVERAEERLGELGFRVLRVRDRGRRARVEVGAAEFRRCRNLEPEIRRRLAPLGFEDLELAVYRSPAPTPVPKTRRS